MATLRRPMSRRMISEIAKVQPLEVQQVIDQWGQFLHSQQEDGQLCYSVYHASFLDFLSHNPLVQAAGETFQNIHKMIADDLWRGLMVDE